MLEDPTVPLEKVMPATAQNVLIVLMAIGALVSLAVMVRESRRRGDLACIFLFIGAGLSIFYEPVGDALVKVYYTEQGQHTWIHAFGRDIPVFIGLLYFWYLPAGSITLLRATRKGVPARTWWSCWAGFVAFAGVFEMVILAICGDTWTYHDVQALKVFGVPLSAPFTYATFDLAIAAGFCALVHFLPRRRQWLIVPAVPMLMTGSHAAASLPVAVALYGTDSPSLVVLGALGSMTFALVFAWIVSHIFRAPWPAERTLGHWAKSPEPRPRVEPAPARPA